MEQNKKNIVRYSFGFLIAFVFLYLAFRGVKFSDLWNSLKEANYWWLILLVPLNILGHWIRAVRWSDLLSPIKSKISMRNLFAGVVIGFAVNNVLPRVGEFVRPYVLGKMEGISRSSVFGTVVVERILDLMTFCFIVCIVLFVFPQSLDPFVSNVALVRPLFLAGSLAAVVVFFKAETLLRAVAPMLRFLPHSYRIRVGNLLEKFYSGFAVAKDRTKLARIVALSFIIWGSYALGMYVPFFAFPSLVRPEMNFGAATVLLVISSISWVLPAPGAMGTYHSFLTIAMMRLYNVEMPVALSYALATHTISYVVVNALGIYYYFQAHLHLAELTSVPVETEGKEGEIHT